jgi:glycerol-3-phosphate dehydrogenase (NAD(P)+)
VTRTQGIGIIGDDRLALGFAHLVAQRGRSVTLFSPSAERRAALRAERADPGALPEVGRLDDGVQVVDDLQEVARASRLVLLSGLGAAPEAALERVGEALDGSHQVVHADHLLHGEQLETASALIRRYTSVRQIGVAAGPLHIGELLAGKPNACEVASPFPDLLKRFKRALDLPNLRIYESRDLVGVELGAALVQIVALAIGITDATEAGAAAHATLMVRGLAELCRVGAALDASPDSFIGLAGLGNLLDGARRGSPDYDLGRLVAGGVVGEVLRQRAPAEATSLRLIPRVRAFARERDLRVPMTATLDEILAGRITPDAVLAELMSPSR